MKTIPLLLGLVAALSPCGGAFAATEEPAPESTPIHFNDPSKPGTLRLSIAMGSISVHGTDSPDVRITSTLRPTSERRSDGLRVLSSASGYDVRQKDNVITVDFGGGFMGHSHRVDIAVPKQTALVISTYTGRIDCSHVDGDVDLHSISGGIDLTDLGGGASVEVQNGRVHASFRTVAKDHPVCITSLNGEVVLTLPPDAKANLQMRTQNGTILTDFDEKELTTAAVDNPRMRTPANAPVAKSGDEGSVYEATREAMRASSEAMREAAREAATAAREAARGIHDGLAESGIQAPIPPLPPLPPMTGGKEVSGVLNGGGVDISVATLNGDVTVRKAAVK